MTSERKIIILTIALFFLSGIYLSIMETRQQDPSINKNWWAVSFDDPKSSALDFTIENHSGKTAFHWTVLTAGKTKLKEGDVTVNKGDTADIKLDGKALSATGKILIDVASGTDKKEIYKNLE
jgi:hypothetical protein